MKRDSNHEMTVHKLDVRAESIVTTAWKQDDQKWRENDEEGSMTQMLQAALLEQQGQAPRQPGASHLEYDLVVGKKATTALLDHGSSRSLMNWDFAVDSGWLLEELKTPLRLIEFTGEGPLLTHQVTGVSVQFAGKESVWNFICVPDFPWMVVLGLDFIKAWQICYDPKTDKVFALDAIQCLTASDTDTEVSVEEGTVVVAVDEAPRETLKKNHIEWMSDEYSDGVLCLHTVTADTAEEQRELQDAMEEMPECLKDLVTEYVQIFQPPLSKPPERSVKHDIVLKEGVVPARRPPYLLGEEKLGAMKEQVAELAQKQWIRPSASPWGAPILFVKKKGGQWRMCVDFRDLNALTVDDAFPLPRVDVLLHRAGRATCFSSLDLASGFHQIAMTTRAMPFTAFRLPEPVLGCIL